MIRVSYDVRYARMVRDEDKTKGENVFRAIVNRFILLFKTKHKYSFLGEQVKFSFIVRREENICRTDQSDSSVEKMKKRHSMKQDERDRCYPLSSAVQSMIVLNERRHDPFLLRGWYCLGFALRRPTVSSLKEENHRSGLFSLTKNHT